jgi:hypothetical protein
MPFIILHGEHDDRLGAHLLFYLNQIFYAYHHRYSIKYDIVTLPYASSLFVKILLNFIDGYNESLPKLEGEQQEVFPFPKKEVIEWSKTMYRTMQCIQMDFQGFWREIYPNVFTDLLHFSTYADLDLPFHPKKTIAVHLRLDDVHDWEDYNGTASANYYRDLVNNNVPIDYMYHVHYYEEYPNIQAPIAMERIEVQIQDAKQRFPDHEVVIISSPSTQHLIQTNYRVICNTDESLDLFLLSIADVIILSRSSFSLSSIIFGNHRRIYAPLWGQMVYYGFYTKHHTNTDIFSYFY